MKLSVFWERMELAFGAAYARSLAADQVLAELQDRTVVQALEQGEDTKTVWRAVHSAHRLPPERR